METKPFLFFAKLSSNCYLQICYFFQDYKFDLICKSHIGREFLLRCKGVGVLPPLKLSDSLIKFCATAVNDTSSTFFSVINDHTSTNQFTHPVPRIGNGDIFPVGPTSFHFVVPNNAPITISPCVGTVFPGEVCFLIFFTPKVCCFYAFQHVQNTRPTDTGILV